MYYSERKLTKLFLAAIVTLTTFGFTAEALWDLQPIELDVKHTQNANADIILDSNDYPHIVFFNDYNLNGQLGLTYTSYDGSRWISSAIENDFLDPYWQDPKALLTADANDVLYVVYQRGPTQLAYKKRQAGTWSYPATIQYSQCTAHDAAVDSLGRLGVVYSKILTVNSDLIFNRGGSSDIIQSNGSFPSASVAFDTNNIPHIVYCDQVSGLLKYAVKSAGGWTIEVIDSIVGVDSYSWGSVSIALDCENVPHISYHNFINADLMYVNKTGAQWSVQAIDTEGQLGRYSSIAVDSNDRVHICYQDNTSGNYAVKYVHATPVGWDFETVDDLDNSGRYVSLALSSLGSPNIVFNIPSTRQIWYAQGRICGTLEYPYPPGDADCNCFVDWFDFQRIAARWFDDDCAAPDYCQNTDLNKSGMVDYADIKIFADYWLDCSMPDCF